MLKHRTATFTRVKATLQQEQFCNYIHRSCMQPRAEGSEYCIRHVLEDKTGPYRQCNYVSGKSGKRCANAAPKAGNRDGYCSEHAARAAMWRQRANRRKRPVDNSGPLLEHLLHYSPELEKSLGRALPQANVISSSNQPSKVLDYDYSSESDQEPIQVDQAWRGDGDSDAESIDSEQEDPLKHAGVYTAEEVALITREKLIRLQSLYIDQFKRLQHLLKEKRRKYLSAKKMEQDILGSVIPSTDEDLDSSDKERLRILRATKRYRKRHGAEALLQSRSNERRIAASESHLVTKPTPPPRCNIIIDGERCSHNVVPMSRFCLQHILHDPHQVLFQHCTHSTGGIEICDKPVAMGMERTTCVLHSSLPPHRFKLPEKEEEMVVEEVKPDVMQIDVEEVDSKPVGVTAEEDRSGIHDSAETDSVGPEGTKEESLGNPETTAPVVEAPDTTDQPPPATSQPSQQEQDSTDRIDETSPPVSH